MICTQVVRSTHLGLRCTLFDGFICCLEIQAFKWHACRMYVSFSLTNPCDSRSRSEMLCTLNTRHVCCLATQPAIQDK